MWAESVDEQFSVEKSVFQRISYMFMIYMIMIWYIIIKTVQCLNYKYHKILWYRKILSTRMSCIAGYENVYNHLCWLSSSICFSCRNTGNMLLHICDWEKSGGSVIFPRNIIHVFEFSSSFPKKSSVIGFD